MNALLIFIAAHMGFLWDKGKFRMIGSETNGAEGDALLVVESKHLRMRFIRDRGQLFLELQPVAETKETWFPVDIIRSVFLGDPDDSGLLDESYANFMGENLDIIEDTFSGPRWPAMREELKEHLAKRSANFTG